MRMLISFLWMAVAALAPMAPPSPAVVALVGGRIYAAPDAPPIEDGVVVAAGFQNSHIHFTEPKWMDVEHHPAPRLTAALDEMLTRCGFTTARVLH